MKNCILVIIFLIFYKYLYNKYYLEVFNNLYKRPSAIIYINLDHRKDRDIQIKKNLSKINYDSVPI